MKPLLITALVILSMANGYAQAGLVGTWIETTDSLREIKIISPTHVFFVVLDAKTDTLRYSGAGTYTISGNTYIEKLQHANFEFDKAGYPFEYSVKGDKFMQDGTLTMADGTRFNVHHIFTRVKSQKPTNGPHVGTWNQLSSTYNMPNGPKGSHTNSTHIRYQIYTPTHWMRLSESNGKFEGVLAGTLKADGDKVTGDFIYTPKPFGGKSFEMTRRIEGKKMVLTGSGKDTEGKVAIEVEDVFEKVD